MVLRSSYSFRNSVGKIDEVASRVKEIGWTHLPIADLSSTFAHGYLKGYNLKPIYGVTIPVTNNPAGKKPIVSEITFLAKKDLQQINSFLQKAFDNFRYTPLLRYSDVNEAQDVITITDHKTQLDLLAPSDSVFVGLSGASAKGYINKAKSLGFKFCAVQNNRYPRKEDSAFYELLVGRGASGQTFNQYIMSDEEWMEEVVGKGFDKDFAIEALSNRDEIFKQCENVVVPKAKLIDPKIEKTLRQICEEGASDLGIDLNDPVYRERLETELEVIGDKQLDDYFKIFSDFMHYARKITICGPARGSASGSLVAYLSKITAVDPVAADLLFFRFLDPGRGGWRLKEIPNI